MSLFFPTVNTSRTKQLPQVDSDRASEDSGSSSSESDQSPNPVYRHSLSQEPTILVNGDIPHTDQSDSSLQTTNQNGAFASPSSSSKTFRDMSRQDSNTSTVSGSNVMAAPSMTNGGLSSSPHVSPSHTRNLSNASSTGVSSMLSSGNAELPYGLVVALHRKMVSFFYLTVVLQKTFKLPFLNCFWKVRSIGKFEIFSCHNLSYTAYRYVITCWIMESLKMWLIFLNV